MKKIFTLLCVLVLTLAVFPAQADTYYVYTANGKTLKGKVGRSYIYTIKPKPSGASSAVTWKSSRSTAAAVTAAGVVTCKAAGSAKITATAKDGSGVKAAFTIKCAK